ncbi:MAG: urea carboxylase-associated family protein [Acetobacteraceae bacterium]
MPERGHTPEPPDAARRRGAPSVVCYAVERLPPYDSAFYERARSAMTKISELTVPPRDGRAFSVPAGHFFRIVSIEGPQVGDLNLWNAADLAERFYSGKTRALHATHLTTGARLWSTFPNFRPLATITHDTLDWYGWDEDGAGVHDVIGTRCDPYTNLLLNGVEYHHCCHSNLTRALAANRNMPLAEAEQYVHDVLNVFMCTGFTRDTHQYFMKASPVRPGDFIEFFAEIELVCGLSACPGGDCSATHSSDQARCFPLQVEIFRPHEAALTGWRPPSPNGYSRTHGVAPAQPSGRAG